MLERLRSAIMGGITGTLEGWRNGPLLAVANTERQREAMYDLLWALYLGDSFHQSLKDARKALGTQYYTHTRRLFTHVPAVVSFYEIHVYLGGLPTDGKRFPDGSRGAIPLDPQTGNDEDNERLLTGTAQLWTRWNWQREMSTRVVYGSSLGGTLTELIDDVDRHIVWPETQWPGRVKEVEIDRVGSVKAYVLEFPVTRVENGTEKTFRFRKEVDKAAFRYYRDDQPWDAFGEGEEVENPYGFVPAIWDRHKSIGSTYGLPAVAGSLRALDELNSILSHGMDYQHKAFGAPVVIKGAALGKDDPLPQGPEYLSVRHVSENGGVEVVPFDLGKTMEIVTWLKEAMYETTPEASFFHELREMSQLSGIGVSRALGDAVSRVKQARKAYDPGSIAIFQMALAMCGFRYNRGDWEDLTERDKAFEPFGLDSFKAGKMDMTILDNDEDRAVIPETPEEKVQRIKLQESMATRWGHRQVGRDEKEITEIFADREVGAF